MDKQGIVERLNYVINNNKLSEIDFKSIKMMLTRFEKQWDNLNVDEKIKKISELTGKKMSIEDINIIYQAYWQSINPTVWDVKNTIGASRN